MQTTNNNKTSIAALLLLPLIGMLGLYLAEMAQSLSGVTADIPLDISGLPPFSMIQMILMISALPIFLVLVAWNRMMRWAALVLVGLMLLFHLLHVLEHVMMADFVASLWILLLCALPSGIAEKFIWDEKPNPIQSGT